MEKWINVKDSLPSKGIVLVTDGVDIATSYYIKNYAHSGEGRWGETASAIKEWNITHWMPLPNLPNKETTEICIICKKEESIRKPHQKFVDNKIIESNRLPYYRKCTKCFRQYFTKKYSDIFGEVDFSNFSDQDYIKLGQKSMSIFVMDAGSIIRDFYKTGDRELIDKILGDFLNEKKGLSKST